MLAHFDVFRSLGREVLLQEIKGISYVKITLSIEKLIMYHLTTLRTEDFQRVSCVYQERNAV